MKAVGIGKFTLFFAAFEVSATAQILQQVATFDLAGPAGKRFD